MGLGGQGVVSGRRSRTLRKPKKPTEKAAPAEPSERRPEWEVQRGIMNQLWEFAYLDDEAGYWKWISEQPGYDPKDEQKRLRAAEAWKAIVSERRRWLRRY